jgi:hypothetical protein
MPLPEDWRAFIELLNSNGVEYVVVLPRRRSVLPMGAGGCRVRVVGVLS